MCELVSCMYVCELVSCMYVCELVSCMYVCELVSCMYVCEEGLSASSGGAVHRSIDGSFLHRQLTAFEGRKWLPLKSRNRKELGGG